jgi:hypothetical protein
MRFFLAIAGLCCGMCFSAQAMEKKEKKVVCQTKLERSLEEIDKTDKDIRARWKEASDEKDIDVKTMRWELLDVHRMLLNFTRHQKEISDSERSRIANDLIQVQYQLNRVLVKEPTQETIQPISLPIALALSKKHN